ncbi:hypothetical protein [Nostoc sphaeroides]|uniref:Alpha/beta hydrolase n=1 Tax=Nostoc sphaeroides CCNUC1 TaxID=2653204 RepID=A0A5P8W414_9NOSO|nr:hypothetical protein [Nostoc sphaeroides]QFS47463.1 hypothetical protein GXM_04955 [Nostoc sphaeroides CCNUC1]
MADYLFIVPGYSDEDFSFVPLRDLLVHEGLYDKDKIKSIEYASLDDQVGYLDFADKFDDIYNKFIKEHPNTPNTRIDILAHSAGSLVVRAWLYMRRTRQKQRKQPIDVPVDHLFLFAPANFGSDLAKIGMSALNAVRITFTKMSPSTLEGNKDLFEVGKRVLEGLEPASPTQWDLSIGDLHKETYFGEHDSTGQCCFPFVFAAGKYNKNLESFLVSNLQKDGTDSIVRIAGTSLNTRMCTLRVISDSSQHQIEWDNEFIDGTQNRRKYEEIAFAIYGQYDHSGIINTEDVYVASKWKPFELFKKAKEINTPEDYKKLARKFSELREEHYIAPKRNKKEEGIFQQFFFKLIDDTEQNVSDFFIEFLVYDKDTKSCNKSLTEKFQRLFTNEDQVGSKTNFHIHSVDRSHRVLMLDITAIGGFVKNNLNTNNQICLKVTAKSPYNGVNFPPSEFVIHSEFVIFDKNSEPNGSIFLFSEFTTTLVHIIIDRNMEEKILREGDFQQGG